MSIKKTAAFLCVSGVAMALCCFYLRAMGSICPDQECVQNSDCGTGFYCHRSYSPKCDEEVCLKGDKASYGLCLPLDDETQLIRSGEDLYTISLKTMNHWSAERFCKAHGKKLFSLNELSCQKPLLNDITAERQACLEPHNATKEQGILFDFPKELFEITGFWLNDVQQNACYAYRVHTSSRMVFRARRSADYKALCVDK